MVETAAFATGRRKTSIARVSLVPGTGKVMINGKEYNFYFGNHAYLKFKIMQPIQLIPEASKYDIIVNVSGGGISGQAEAIRHGIARALVVLNPSYRKILDEKDLLRRDPRMVERKKAGQPKARKRFQWTKR